MSDLSKCKFKDVQLKLFIKTLFYVKSKLDFENNKCENFRNYFYKEF